LSRNSLDEANRSFINLRKHTQNSHLRDFQFKLLHGIISTRDKLFKYKYITDNHCLTCLESDIVVKDDITHTLIGCPVSRSSWSNFSDFLLHNLNVQVEVDIRSLTEGFDVVPITINEIVIQIKKILHKPMSIRRIVTIDQIESLFKTQETLQSSLKQIKLSRKLISK